MEILKQITEAVREAGKIILNADRSNMDIDSKTGRGNFVTEYDKKVQDFLFEKLMKIIPEAEFVGEENEASECSYKGYTYVVDPIDGTMNFVRDNHASAISVGVLYDGEPFMGAVYNPYLDEMYYGKKNEGAYLNGKRIFVSKRDIEDGIVMAGTSPYYSNLFDDTIETIRKYLKSSLDIRRSGAASLDLCSIAAGRAELFFELILSAWDYTASALIIKEAGGIITAMDGSPLRYDKPCSVLAKNK